MNKKNVFLFLSVLASLIFGWLYVHHYQINAVKTQQIEAITDTARLYRTKTGASGTERKIFVGTRDEALAVLKNTDPKVYNTLKNTPNVHTYTNMQTTTKVDTVVKADTVYMVKDSTGKLDYILSKTITEPKGFYTAKVDVRNDSVGLRLQMKDSYTIVSKEKSNGLFKPKSYVINVENTNPYISLTDVKSFEIQPENNHTGLKIGGVAVAISVGAFFLLKH